MERLLLTIARWILLMICVQNAWQSWHITQSFRDIVSQEGLPWRLLVSISCVFILVRIVQALLLTILDVPVSRLWGVINFSLLLGAFLALLLLVPFWVIGVLGVIGFILWSACRQAYNAAQARARIPGRLGTIYLRALFEHTHPFFQEASTSILTVLEDWSYLLTPYIP